MTLWALYTDILLPAQAVLMDMEVGGIRVDLAKLKELRGEAKRLHKDALKHIQDAAQVEHRKRLHIMQMLLAQMEQAREVAKENKHDTKPLTKELAKHRTKIKQWGEDKFRPTNHNWSTLLFDIMGLKPPPRSKTKAGAQQVNDKVFEYLIKQYPEVEVLRWRDEAQGQLKRYSTQFGIRVDNRGFTHPSYSIHKTATKRVASGSDTSDSGKTRKSDAGNLQNIPDPDRVIYIPDEDEGSFLAADWSQIQALILFWFAQEWEACKLIKEGDIHTHNAQILAEALGLSKPHSKLEAEMMPFPGSKRSLRHHAKPMSYGVGFGMRERKAQIEYGGDIKTWKRVIDATFEAWPGLRRLHKEIRDEVESTRKLRNPWGLIQWFSDFERKGGSWKLSEDSFREAVAWKVQSSEAMMCLTTLPNMVSLLNSTGARRRLVTTTHDSFLISLPAALKLQVGICVPVVQQVKQLLERPWREMGTQLIAAINNPKPTVQTDQEDCVAAVEPQDFSVKADMKLGKNWASKSPSNPQGLGSIL